MKKIEAIIKPFKLDDVRDALGEAGIQGMTVSEVRDFAGQKGQKGIFRGTQYTVDFLPKIKIEIVLSDDRLDSTVSTIIKAAQTNKTDDDGNIFVSSIDEVVRIRSEERGRLAA